MSLIVATALVAAAVPVSSAGAAVGSGAPLQAAETVKEELMFGEDCYTYEKANAFAVRPNGDYVKLSSEEGRDYIYLNGEAFEGTAYVVSGTVAMSRCAEDAVAEIVLKAEEGYARFILRFDNQTNYSLIAHVNANGADTYKTLPARDSGRMNFLIMWHESNAYLYVDNTFVTQIQTPFERTHLGFGGAGSRLSVECLSAAKNGQLIEKLLSDLSKPFGRHVTGDAEYYEAVFLKTGDGEYEKRTYHYLQTFCYLGGKPAAGEYYWIEGVLTMKNPEANGQAALMVTRDDGNKVRFVLEYDEVYSRYFIFKDECLGGTFTNYRHIGNVANTVRFKVEYDHGVSRLYLDGRLVQTVERDMGAAHFGLGGDNCQFSVSGLRGGFEAEE